MSPREGADKEFLSESEELIETLGRDLLRYEDAVAGGGRVDPDILNGIFRAAHSLKGLAGMFGFSELGDMAHSMENILDRMRLGKVKPQQVVLDVLFTGVECLKDLLAEEEGSSERAQRAKNNLADVSEGKIPADLGKKGTPAPGKAVPQIAIDESSDGDSVIFEGVPIPKSVMDVLTEYEEFRLLENIRCGINIIKANAGFDITDFDIELPKLMEWLKLQGEVITTLPGGGPGEGDKIFFDLLVGTELQLDSIEVELKRMGFSMSVIRAASDQPGEIKPPPKSAPAPEPPPRKKAKEEPKEEPKEKDEEDIEEGREAETETESARSVSNTVRVDISRLDILMNIVGELVIEKSVIGNIRDQLTQEPGMRLLANQLYKAHRNLDRKLAELQEAVMDVRMVPVGQLFGRLGRIVRKVGREQNKNIEFIRTGMETELDKLIIEELADPLMHIIRNSIDHGIEPPEVRRECGKPEKGRIELHAYQQGNHVVIEVFDDGGGIDAIKVRKKAEKLGLIPPNTDKTEEEIYDLMFEAGVSTKDAVSELSGRGVGLDVVKRNIGNLSGLIEVDSVFGEYTFFTITLPITLAIIQALIVECSGRTYALPLNSVRECHILKPEDIKTIEQREVMELREQTIPLLRLANLFGYEKGDGDTGSRPEIKKAKQIAAVEKVPDELLFQIDPEDDEERKFVVIIGIAERRMGVLVDRMIGRQDVVIKSLGKTLGNIPGVAGATDLGNQHTVLVLDVGDLLEEIGHSTERSAGQLRGR